MTAIYVVGLFLVGALLGSYAGAVITRYPKSSAMDGRSECFHCHTQLQPIDLVPLLSYIYLRGRCRYCKERIDGTHQRAELLGALGLPALYFLLPSPVFLPAVGALLLCSIVLAGVDLRTMKLPNSWVLGTAAIAAFLAVQAAAYYYDSSYLVRFGVTGVATAAMYALLSLSTRGRGIGMGDAKLAPIIAACAGLVSYPSAVVAVFLPFVLGTLVVMVRALRGISWRRQQIPFGPFLLTGGWLAAFLGDIWVHGYMSIWA